LLWREETTGKNPVLTGEETKYFQFYDVPKIAKKIKSTVKKSDSTSQHLLSKRAFSSPAKSLRGHSSEKQ